MKYKILIPNSEDGRFYFTKEQLEELLDKTYNEGYEDGRKERNMEYIPYPGITYPYTPSNPYNPVYEPSITCCDTNTMKITTATNTSTKG